MDQGVVYSDSRQMLEDQRSKKVIFVCHCLLDSNTKVLERARYSGVHNGVMQVIQQYGLGVVQMPCTEMLYFGSNRYWGGKNVFDSSGYRRFCREQAVFMVDYIENFSKVGIQAVCIVGCDGSPTCGVRYTNHYLNGGGRPKPLDREVIEGQGVFMEEIAREAQARGVVLPEFYGIGLDLFSKEMGEMLEEFSAYLKERLAGL